jgi:hypothetical protein
MPELTSESDSTCDEKQKKNKTSKKCCYKLVEIVFVKTREKMIVVKNNYTFC